MAHLALLAWLALQVPVPLGPKGDGPLMLSLGSGPMAGAPSAARPAAPASVAPPAEPPPAEPTPPPPDPMSQASVPTPPPLMAASVSQPSTSPPSPNRVATTAAPGTTASAGGGGNRCVVFDQIRARLQTDPQVQAALRRIPKSARSVANAIQFWDGSWVDPSPPGAPSVIGPIQEAVAQTVEAAPPACRLSQVRGPQMIVVEDGSDATIMSFGSGEWTWSQLLPDAGASPSRAVQSQP